METSEFNGFALVPGVQEVYVGKGLVVVCGVPACVNDDDHGPCQHNCDAMGCGSVGPHVLLRAASDDPAELRAQRDELLAALERLYALDLTFESDAPARAQARAAIYRARYEGKEPQR